MHSHFNVVFSNRAEILFQGFKEQLFTHSHPFSRRIVIVPSAAMKSWLMLQMAQDSGAGIAAGIEIGFVEPTLKKLHTLLIQKEDGAPETYEPTLLELALAIESEIYHVLRSYRHLSVKEQQIWHPLFDYLGGMLPDEESIAKRTSKRASALSVALAKLFVKYGCYGGELLAAWELAPGHWQALLWKKMEARFAAWNYPLRKFSSAPLAEVDPQEVQIHAFGLSYLAPVYHRFLLHLSQKVPVHYYVLSPCQKFWADLLSEKESLRLNHYWERKAASAIQQDLLEDYLRDSNPLLANFGRLGREMASQLEACDPMMTEHYQLPAAIQAYVPYSELLTPEVELSTSHRSLASQGRAQQEVTLLEALQADMALLRNPEEGEKLNFTRYDGTLQVHAAPKPMREVQVIYDLILSLIDKHRHDAAPILPGEIVVMASNLSKYEPFIRTVFEASESALQIHLLDLNIPSQNRIVQGFVHLLRLPLGRWDRVSLLRLFDYPAFQLCHQFKPEEVEQIHRWIEEMGICWGTDALHRNALLRRDHCTKEMVEDSWHGTWEYEMGLLLNGLAMAKQSDHSGSETVFSPAGHIETSQGVLLGTLLRLLRSLIADLRPLMDDTSLTLQEWSDYLNCLYGAYFKCGEDEEAREGDHLVRETIRALGAANTKLGESTFAFHSIRRHLEQIFQSQTSAYRESNLQAVRFCSLLPMRAVPAKVIILMGMGDGEFPRSDEEIAFNLLNDYPQGDYCPGQTDFDRYLFLEALLSARRYFIMSYVDQKPGNAQVQLPSLLVSELLAYIDKAYRTPDGSLKLSCCTRHPLFSFDKSYFTEESIFKSYALASYRAALAYYRVDKIPSHNFLAGFELPAAPLVSGDLQTVTVRLADLLAFIKNPIKVYLNKTLDIYFERQSERQINNDEALLLSNLDASILLKKSLHLPADVLIRQAEMHGNVPRGPFRDMETARLRNEISSLDANLKGLGVISGQLKTIEFSEQHQRLRQTAAGWQAPPLSIEVPFIGLVRIVGRLETISAEGLVVIAEDEMKETIKYWPAFLVYACLVDAHALPLSKKLLFIKGEKGVAKSDYLDHPQIMLMHYLEYYFKGLQSPSPLMPECVAPMVVGAFDKVKSTYQSIEDEFNPIYDEYLKWIKRSSPRADIDATLEQWQVVAKTLFLDMHQEWYAKKTAPKQGRETLSAV